MITEALSRVVQASCVCKVNSSGECPACQVWADLRHSAQSKDREAETLRARVKRAEAQLEDSAARNALDKIAELCGCPEWDYPGQLVRDVEALKARAMRAEAERDEVIDKLAAEVFRRAAAELRCDQYRAALREINDRWHVKKVLRKHKIDPAELSDDPVPAELREEGQDNDEQGWPTELIEELAALEHERWSGWERYRAKAFTERHHNGEMNIERWIRQCATVYADLSEQEKESDRAEVHKTLAVLARHGIRAELSDDGKEG